MPWECGVSGLEQVFIVSQLSEDVQSTYHQSGHYFSLFRFAVMDEGTICFNTSQHSLIFPWKPNSLPWRPRCCPVRDVLCLYTSPPLMSQVYILSLDIHLIKAIIVNNLKLQHLGLPTSFSDDTIQKSSIVLISF